jgi:bacterioferritin-associated ferredoxin
MTQSLNPLRKYFRQPAIHLRLPSNGKFYPPGAIELPPNGEVPIYPMTAVDEIITRTPDALFNGSSIVEIIASCVPAIKDAWQVPAVDLNALLTAVRLASYGHEMDIASRCPSCQEIDNFTVDLRAVLDSISAPDYDTPLSMGDLTVYFVPMNYQQINEVGRVQYEDQKIMQMVNNSELSEEEKMSKLGEAFKRITQLTVRSIAASINAIKSDDAMVTDSQQIEEFLLNIDKAVFETIKQKVLQLREATDLKPISIQCSLCSHEYQQSFTLDMSNFFETAS